MKNFKTIFFALLCISIISCSSDDNDTSSNDGLFRWSFKLDGQLYAWEGTLGGNGGATYSAGTLALSSIGSQTIGVTCAFPSINTGDFIFDSTTDNFQINIAESNLSSSTMYSTSAYGGQINVNISSLSNNTIVDNPTNPGKVKGTFEGVINGFFVPVGSPGGETTGIITEGVFEAVRAN